MSEFLRKTAWAGYYIGYAGTRVTPALGLVWLTNIATSSESLNEFYNWVGLATVGSALVTVLAIVGGLAAKSIAGENEPT